MASLLDMIVRNRGGAAPGPGASPLSALLSAPRQGQAPQSSGGSPPPPARPRGGPSEDFLSRLMGVTDDPFTTAEQEQQARRQGLISAGLGTISADPGAGTLPRAAAGLQQGRGVASGLQQQFRDQTIEAAEKARQIAVQARTGQLLSGDQEGIQREDAERALQFAIAAGANDTAKNLRSFIADMPGETEYRPRTIELADGTRAVFDPNNRSFYNAAGEPIMELPSEVAGEEDELETYSGVDPATGDPVTGVINLDTGTFTPVEGVVDAETMKASQTKLDDDSIKLAERATKARANYNTIEDYLTTQIEENPQNPLRGIRFDRARFEQTGLLVPAAQRDQLDTETQQFLQAQSAFMIELANRYAGVRGVSNEDARRAIYRTFGFEEGDSAENIRNTLRELNIGVRSLELQAGSALKLFQNIGVGAQAGEQENSNGSSTLNKLENYNGS